MSLHTRSQRLAQAAYTQIARYNPLDKEYVSFAKKFPALIHTCGLTQAVAFALAKNKTDYIADLTEVLKAADHTEITNPTSLDNRTRTTELSGYLCLSRDALSAAGWLKRYVESMEGED